MSLSIRGLNVSLSKNHILKDINLDIQKKKINPCQKYERKAIEINQ